MLAATGAALAVETVRHHLTYDRPGSSEHGANPTHEDVLNHSSMEVLKSVMNFFEKSHALYVEVFPKVHREHWERVRQSPSLRHTVPEVYQPPL